MAKPHMATPEMVPFTSAAAGHQGISTSSDGSLLIKPCVQAEIDFYESAKNHPTFQAHMPVYMGSLSLGDNNLQKQAGLHQAQQTGEVDPATALPKAPARTATASAHRRTESGHIISEPRITRSATKEWTPSGGAKLSSNLSIVLSNATAGFKRPNVIDLKLGARLWDDDAAVAKRAKLDEVANSSTSGSLGFRVAGMKVFVGENTETDFVQREVNTEVHDGYKTYNKFYGRDSIKETNIRSAFEAFFYGLGLELSTPESRQSSDFATKKLLKRKLLLERLLREISSIQYSLETEESRMYSASILMVYEGDPDAFESAIRYEEKDGKVLKATAIEVDVEEEQEDDDEIDDEDEDEQVKQKLHEVVVIDFAHAHWTPGQGPDENALKGVRNVKTILQGLLDDVTTKL